MLPGLTDEQCFRRLKEIEETVLSLTNAETPGQAMDRYAIVRPRARLQKLTVRIRKLKERYVEGIPKSNLQLLVLEKLETAKGEFAEEIDRLEAVFRQREKPHSPIPETSNGQNRSDTPPLADQAINETGERTGTPLNGQLETDQPGVSEPGVTEERVKTLIQEFADSTVKPLEAKVKKTLRQTLLLAEKTRDNLVKAEERITKIEAKYRDDTIMRNEHHQQTKALEDKTSGIVDDLDRLERQTDQRLKEVTEDLVGSTLNRVSELEKKNASLEDSNEKLEADFKALTEQVNELIKAKVNADIAVEEANARATKEVQDALDEETRRAKEAPRLSEEEIAERERNLMAKNSAFARSIAAQAREDAERLNNERQRLDEFATAHNKKKAASSSSAPAKRKRKPSKKAQVAGLLERITETNVDTPPDPPQSEDEDEEHLAERPTRQRVYDTVPISTISQPQAEGSSSRPDKEKPTKDMMDGFRFSDSE
ncbi:myosin-13-like [Impatiens glandulifera]|uniref:myosin-13-like n=1 Tax=Impatiens glandulifera TaxID=253017 RepID=UPI001FB0AD81|nr:myosin-13-like [Impatiens glandulifera]